MNNSQEEYLENAQNAFKSNHYLDDENLRKLKEYIEIHQSHSAQMDQVYLFFNMILIQQPVFKENQKQKTRFTILDMLSKGILQNLNFSPAMERLFLTLLNIIKEDNNINAIPAKLALVEIIKKNENRQQTLEQNFPKLFDYFQQRTEFLIEKCKGRNPIMNQIGALDDYEIQPNQYSVKFLNELPNIIVMTLNYVDIRSNDSIRDYLQNSIVNILTAIKETNQERFQFPNETNDIFNVLTKMFQFISVILRKDIRNQNYMHNAQELVKITQQIIFLIQ